MIVLSLKFEINNVKFSYYRTQLVMDHGLKNEQKERRLGHFGSLIKHQYIYNHSLSEKQKLAKNQVKTNQNKTSITLKLY